MHCFGAVTYDASSSTDAHG